MKKILIIILFLIISVLIQHVTHELLHVLVGRLMGFSLKRIQWFTYYGGTRVFFENEPEISDEATDVPKEWFLTSAAGIVGTTLLGYISVFIFAVIPTNLFRLFMWVLSIMLLLTDSSYALAGSAGNFGDMCCIGKYLKWSRKKKIAVSLVLFIVNCIIVKSVLF